MSTRLYEAGGSKPRSKGNGIFDVCIIKSGWGSSGFYSDDLLKEYGPSVFRAGRPSFANHPTEAEFANGRDVTKIMGKLITDAEFREDKEEGNGLWAQMKVNPTWIPFVEEYKDSIGLSIFASGEISEGEVDGRHGTIVESFDANDPYTSVDFVVAAGAGGKVGRMLESFNAVQSEALSSDRDRELRDLARAEYAAENTWVWVRDFDDKENVVYFVVEDNDSSKIYRQTYSVDNDKATGLTGSPEEVRAVTKYENVRTNAESADAETHKENGMTPEEKDALVTDIVTKVIEALKPAAPNADEETKPTVADVAEAVATSGLPESARKRVYAAIEAGTDVTKAIEAEKALRDEILAEAKIETPVVGRVRESGTSTFNPSVSGW